MTLNLVLLQLLLRFEKLGTGDTLEGALVSFSMFAERGIMICGETTIFNSTMELRHDEGLTLSLVSWEGTILDKPVTSQTFPEIME